MDSAKIRHLIAQKRTLETSLNGAEKTFDELLQPAIINVLADYNLYGRGWPGMEEQEVTRAINQKYGFGISVFEVRCVLLAMAESQKIKNEQSGYYRVDPFDPS